MRSHTRTFLLLLALSASVGGCGDSGDGDADADADHDGDLDEDGDADADGDADSSPPPGLLGDACEDNGDCESGLCVPEWMLPEIVGGYCTQRCELDDPDTCEPNALCVDIGLGIPFCMKQCADESDCRDDWDCVGVCLPGQDVAEVTPTDRLDPADEVVSGVVAAMDQDRMREHIEVLSGAAAWESPDGAVTITSRSVFHEDHALAAAYLVAAFSELGLEVETVDFDWAVEEDGEPYSGSGQNIIARLEGTDPDLEPVLMTAHYDSAAHFSDGWDPPSDPAPGASDNGSGVAIALELARVLSAHAEADPAPRTFVFVLFDVEEMGMVGSFSFVDEMPESEAPLCALNVDMVAWDLELWPGRYWYAFHPDHSAMASFDYEAIREFVPDAHPILSDAVDSMMFGGSDHLPFWQAGYCATYFSNWPLVGVYHTFGDQVETYDWPFFMGVARSAAVVTATWGYRWE